MNCLSHAMLHIFMEEGFVQSWRLPLSDRPYRHGLVHTAAVPGISRLPFLHRYRSPYLTTYIRNQ